MKKLTYLLAAAAVLAACNGNKGYTVTGTVEGASDGDTVYRLDRTLALSQPEQYIPTCYTEVSADGKTKTEAEKPNLFCSYIEIILSAESSPTRKIPPDIAVDSSYIRIWDSFGEELADMDFNFEEGEIKFFGI